MVANEAAALKELLVRVVNEGTGSSKDGRLPGSGKDRLGGV